jgi:hypothetical protein
MLDVNAFLRESNDRIFLLVSNTQYKYDNVGKSRALGFEGVAEWASPGRWLFIDANATVQDVRNVSTERPFSDYYDDRFPNQPWLLANLEVRVELRPRLLPNDRLTPFYQGRYVNEFFRTWESLGRRQPLWERDNVIPSQLTHNVGVSYAMQGIANVTSTLEIQNVTDAQVYDFYRIPKPGRAFFFKGILDY